VLAVAIIPVIILVVAVWQTVVSWKARLHGPAAVKTLALLWLLMSALISYAYIDVHSVELPIHESKRSASFRTGAGDIYVLGHFLGAERIQRYSRAGKFIRGWTMSPSGWPLWPYRRGKMLPTASEQVAYINGLSVRLIDKQGNFLQETFAVPSQVHGSHRVVWDLALFPADPVLSPGHSWFATTVGFLLHPLVAISLWCLGWIIAALRFPEIG
jgi:hypothetical protein